MQTFQGFNWVDNLLLAILLVSAGSGLFRGAVREVVSLLSWFAGYIVGASFSRPVAKLFANSDLFGMMAQTASDSLGTDATAQASMFAVGVSFIVLFSVTVFIGTLVGRSLSGMFEADGISFINRFLGIIFGAARGYLASLVLIFIVNLTPMATEDAWTQSKMVEKYQPGVKLFSVLVQPSVEQMKKRVNSIDTPIPLYR